MAETANSISASFAPPEKHEHDRPERSAHASRRGFLRTLLTALPPGGVSER